MERVLIIIPTYNERENLSAIIKAVEETLSRTNDGAGPGRPPSPQPWQCDFLVIDDNSPDGTGQLADELAAADPHVKVLHRPGKLGLGTAYIAGFRFALRENYDYVFEMDADFSHDPRYLAPMVERARGGADVVIGSRWVDGGGTENWGIRRQFISRGGSLYARTILGVGIRDLTSGFICWRRRVLESIGLEQVQSNGYSFQIEMKYRAVKAGFRVAEVPIVFVDRRVGVSKMSRKIFVEALSVVWKLRLGIPGNVGEETRPSRRRFDRRGKVYIDGALFDPAEARIDVFDRGFLYGDSVYEVLRTHGLRPHALSEHLARLAESARRIGMELPPAAEIAAALDETIRAAGESEVYVRIVVTRGGGPLGLDPALSDGPRLIVIALSLVLPDVSLYRDGAEVAIVTPLRRNAPGGIDPQVKSGNYLTSVMAVAEARARGAYEALMCDAVGRLSEGSSSNLFVVRGGRVSTPPLSVGLLEGITRRHVIALARGSGVPVDEVPLWPLDLRGADEAFITSSIRGVMPIVRVDGAVLGEGKPGPVTRGVMAAYDEETRRT